MKDLGSALASRTGSSGCCSVSAKTVQVSVRQRIHSRAPDRWLAAVEGWLWYPR